MATYSIINEQNLSVIDLNVTFPVNVTCTYPNQVFSNNTGAALDFQFAEYSATFENDIKTMTYFSTQDTARNATYTLTPDPTQTNLEEGYSGYICTISFTIENAVVLQQIQRQTELTGTEREDFLNAEADTVEANFKSERGWTDL